MSTKKRFSPSINARYLNLAPPLDPSRFQKSELQSEFADPANLAPELQFDPPQNFDVALDDSSQQPNASLDMDPNGVPFFSDKFEQYNQVCHLKDEQPVADPPFLPLNALNIFPKRPPGPVIIPHRYRHDLLLNQIPLPLVCSPEEPTALMSLIPYKPSLNYNDFLSLVDALIPFQAIVQLATDPSHHQPRTIHVTACRADSAHDVFETILLDGTQPLSDWDTFVLNTSRVISEEIMTSGGILRSEHNVVNLTYPPRHILTSHFNLLSSSLRTLPVLPDTQDDKDILDWALDCTTKLRRDYGPNEFIMNRHFSQPPVPKVNVFTRLSSNSLLEECMVHLPPSFSSLGSVQDDEIMDAHNLTDSLPTHNIIPAPIQSVINTCIDDNFSSDLSPFTPPDILPQDRMALLKILATNSPSLDLLTTCSKHQERGQSCNLLIPSPLLQLLVFVITPLLLATADVECPQVNCSIVQRGPGVNTSVSMKSSHILPFPQFDPILQSEVNSMYQDSACCLHTWLSLIQTFDFSIKLNELYDLKFHRTTFSKLVITSQGLPSSPHNNALPYGQVVRSFVSPPCNPSSCPTYPLTSIECGPGTTAHLYNNPRHSNQYLPSFINLSVFTPVDPDDTTRVVCDGNQVPITTFTAPFLTEHYELVQEPFRPYPLLPSQEQIQQSAGKLPLSQSGWDLWTSLRKSDGRIELSQPIDDAWNLPESDAVARTLQHFFSETSSSSDSLDETIIAAIVEKLNKDQFLHCRTKQLKLPGPTLSFTRSPWSNVPFNQVALKPGWTFFTLRSKYFKYPSYPNLPDSVPWIDHYASTRTKVKKGDDKYLSNPFPWLEDF